MVNYKQKNIEVKFYPALISGLLLSLSFPPFPFFFLAFIAFIPILYVIENQIVTGKKGSFKWFYLSFVLNHTISNWWISSFQDQTDPFLMASGFALDILHPLFFLIPVFIYKHIRASFGSKAILLFPFIWTGWEYFHSLGEFSYPWLSVGNTQIYNLTWIQFIDITGVFGATFLITMVNAILYYAYNNIKNGIVKKQPGINITPLIIVLLIIYLPIIYGNIRLNEFRIKKGKEIKICIVQPNLNPWEKWSGGNKDQIYQMMGLQDSLKKTGESFDLGLWPETSILRIKSSFNSDLKLSFLQNWVNKNEPIISGFVHDKKFTNGEKPSVTGKIISEDLWIESYNSSVFVNSYRKTQVYDKSKLTPFAERIPNIERASFLLDYLAWGVGISSWGIGSGPATKTIYYSNDSVKVGSIICIESIYPEFCKEFTAQGAEFLTIITNDAWYDGTPGPEQHFQIARVRAIENRRYIARCGNSGVSGIIAPTGEVIKKMPEMRKLADLGSVKRLTDQSIYVKRGDSLLAKPMMYFSIGLWIISINLRFRRKKLVI